MQCFSFSVLKPREMSNEKLLFTNPHRFLFLPQLSFCLARYLLFYKLETKTTTTTTTTKQTSLNLFQTPPIYKTSPLRPPKLNGRPGRLLGHLRYSKSQGVFDLVFLFFLSKFTRRTSVIEECIPAATIGGCVFISITFGEQL